MTLVNADTGEIVQRDLDTLATSANEFHSRAHESAYSAVEWAIKCGEALNEAKTQVAHGDWGRWLADHFDGTQRTAQHWMKLAANAKRVSHLDSPSIRAALDAISEPKPKPEPEPSDDSGAPEDDSEPVEGDDEPPARSKGRGKAGKPKEHRCATCGEQGFDSPIRHCPECGIHYTSTLCPNDCDRVVNDRQARISRIYSGLEYLGRINADPATVVAEIPAEQAFRIESFIDDAINWLERFREEWKKRPGADQ